jgi:hypothetical protein
MTPYTTVTISCCGCWCFILLEESYTIFTQALCQYATVTDRHTMAVYSLPRHCWCSAVVYQAPTLEVIACAARAGAPDAIATQNSFLTAAAWVNVGIVDSSHGKSSRADSFWECIHLVHTQRISGVA